MPSNPKEAFEAINKGYFEEDFDPVKDLLVRLRFRPNPYFCSQMAARQLIIASPG